ncbi:thioredoxin [Geotalea uraniireducens]|uniref:Thioredoxin n=1 Tax=Geotalea uraniireducens TaxID=351604 RepID=A0ABN6VST4_9BACT|nr:thioredoxin domain-containing protein [Geotalea uraniireducens]BDV42487.1 thioredoxin [Geotalea uraniireducens]
MNEQGVPPGEEGRLARILAVDRQALPADGGDEFNRLIFASSPYLLQHADNPVDWYPWGDEAFARARSEDRPIFLSIGYATCHWCHVMARESFVDRAVAAVINRHFVAIKVDREERPDIDALYMRVAQMMNGSGGWPLTIIMTPDRQPFFAATYLPKEPREGMPGLTEILDRIAAVWRDHRELVRQNCAAIMAGVQRVAERPAASGAGGEPALHEARRQLAAICDREYGGFGAAPKFPMALSVSLLLRYAARFADDDAAAMAATSLTAMRRGGIWDQLGGGIHRYCVDRQWLIPHFEKMLYDQALCAMAYLEMFQYSGRVGYREAAVAIGDFVLRELAAPGGGFYSALDADSNGEEGGYYLWTPAGIREVLGTVDGDRCCRLFGVTAQGNFAGKNVLHLPLPFDEAARREGLAPEAFAAAAEEWRRTLLARREERRRPFRDEKLITGWNGLMIGALARTFLVSGDERFLRAAEVALAVIRTELTTQSGRLLRSKHRGAGDVPAFLDDYAAVIFGLLELSEATLDPARLGEAGRLADEMLRLFGGGPAGLYDTGDDTETVLFRRADLYDGAIPAGNSLAATVLVRLGRLSGETRFETTGCGIVTALLSDASRQPLAFSQLLIASDILDGEPMECTVEGEGDPGGLRDMLRVLGGRYLPGRIVRLADAATGSAPGGRKAAVRVCARGACHPAVESAAELEALLDRLAGWRHVP